MGKFEDSEQKFLKMIGVCVYVCVVVQLYIDDMDKWWINNNRLAS